jgi:hypothetical protein
LNGDGSFTYTPSIVFSGRDSFSYSADDGQAFSARVTVTLIVPAPRDITPPEVSLAGGARVVQKGLVPARGGAADVYVLRGVGIVVTSGLRDVALQLQRGDGQFWNGRSYQRAPFNLRTRLFGRAFFALVDSMPTASPEGAYRWTAIARDNAGNVSRVQQIAIVDRTPPGVNLAPRPSDSSELVVRVSPGVVSVRASVRRSDGLYFNGRAFQIAPVLLSLQRLPSAPQGGLYGLSLPSSPASYLIELSAQDEAGNVGTNRTQVQITSTSAR